MTNLRFTGTPNNWWDQSPGAGVVSENRNATPMVYQGTFTDTLITNADVKSGTV